MSDGTVEWYDSKKGYGFLVNKKRVRVFMHKINIINSVPLEKGQRVTYEEVSTDKGVHGRNIKPIEKGGISLIPE